MAQNKDKTLKKRIAGAYISSVISISLVLLLLGAASLLLVNAHSVENWFKENLRVTVLMKQGTAESQAHAYQKEIEALPFVKETRYVSVEEGTVEMVEMLGKDFLDVFSTSPVPSSVEVTLKAEYVAPDSLVFVERQLAARDCVESVNSQSALVESLSGSIAKIGAVLGLLMILLLFISTVLIASTVRLNIHSHRFTIHTMQLVGATGSFISGPYVRKAVLQGFISAVLALAALAGLLWYVGQSFPRLLEIFSRKLLIESGAIVLVAGVLLCVICTACVVNRITRYDNNALYE